jgi:aryl-alcohol dehydrogenase-like predicted oxidoreductase
LRSIDGSLRRLRTDYVDIYYIHRWDYDTPIEETLDTLADVVRSGKARYLAASSMFAWQFSKLICDAKCRHQIPFIAMQAQYNLAYREEEFEMTPLCLAEGVGMVPWSPLARGFLSGSRSRSGPGSTIRSQTDDLEQKRYRREADFQVLDALLSVSRERAMPPARVAMAWLLSKPVVTAPVVGITKLEQLKDAFAAIDVALTPHEIARLEAPYRRRDINDHS